MLQFETHSFLVETSGPLIMVRNCFSFNEVGVANVATYGAGSLYYDNYQQMSAGLKCPFVSRYMTATQVAENTPFCLDFDAVVCGAGATSAPTSQSPTTAPTSLFQPSAAPMSSFPTFFPTVETSTEDDNVVPPNTDLSTYSTSTALPDKQTIPPLSVPALDANAAASQANRSSGTCLVSFTEFHWMVIVVLGFSSTLHSCLV
jgi:hypothetical protein